MVCVWWVMVCMALRIERAAFIFCCFGFGHLSSPGAMNHDEDEVIIVGKKRSPIWDSQFGEGKSYLLQTLQNDCASQWTFISSKESSAEMYFLQKYLPRVSFDLHSCPLTQYISDKSKKPSWFEDCKDDSSQGIQKFMIPKLTDYENDLFKEIEPLFLLYS
jgi:hypothetical protein